MTRAADAYQALVASLEHQAPACHDDARYLTDAGPIHPELLQLCAACPVFTECRQYALVARPPAGVWAGERWTTPKLAGRPRKGVAP